MKSKKIHHITLFRTTSGNYDGLLALNDGSRQTVRLGGSQERAWVMAEHYFPGTLIFAPYREDK